MSAKAIVDRVNGWVNLVTLVLLVLGIVFVLGEYRQTVGQHSKDIDSLQKVVAPWPNPADLARKDVTSKDIEHLSEAIRDLKAEMQSLKAEIQSLKVAMVGPKYRSSPNR